jgi:uncharacterized protein YgfB (UPF0149 family)
MSNFEEKSGNLYENFEDALSTSDCDINASEIQGVLAGMISVGLKTNDPHWSGTLLEIVNDGKVLTVEAQALLTEVFTETFDAFNEDDGLAPILVPNDQYPLIDRLEAISLWSQGYLLGFGLQQGKRAITSKEINEALLDISEISQLELSSDESEESQMALITLIEHIKVAVKVIYLELVMKDEPKDKLTVDGNGTFH